MDKDLPGDSGFDYTAAKITNIYPPSEYFVVIINLDLIADREDIG